MIATVVFLHVLLYPRPLIAGAAKVGFGTRPAVISNAFANLMVKILQRMVSKSAKLAQKTHAARRVLIA
jgi:hypothetical protein